MIEHQNAGGNGPLRRPVQHSAFKGYSACQASVAGEGFPNPHLLSVAIDALFCYHPITMPASPCAVQAPLLPVFFAQDRSRFGVERHSSSVTDRVAKEHTAELNAFPAARMARETSTTLPHKRWSSQGEASAGCT